MRYRNLHLSDGIWKYAIGNSYVAIRGPNGERFNPTCSEVTGIQDWERAKHKNYAKVLPSQVKEWIEQHK